MKTRPTRRRRCAFTLLEILVVLAIVALLSALLFTVFAHVREGGRRTLCLSNQRQIVLALQLYQEDAAGHFPFYNALDVHSLVWIDALLPYAKTPPLFVCPSDAQIEDKRIYGFVTVTTDGSKHPTIPSSYIANEQLLWRNEKGKIRPLALSEVENPAEVVFATDGVKQALPPYPLLDRQGRFHQLFAQRFSVSGLYFARPKRFTGGRQPYRTYRAQPRATMAARTCVSWMVT